MYNKSPIYVNMEKELLISIAKTIIENFFLNWLDEKKTSFFEKIKVRCFIKNLNRKVRTYIINHDGTILTTGDFEKFLQYHNLLENIFQQVLNNDGSLSKDAFVKEQISKFHNMQKHPENNRIDTDNVLKSFIIFVYDETDRFYRKRLSTDYQYVISNENETKALIKENNRIDLSSQKKLDHLIQVIEQEKKINNPKTVYEIFSVLYSFVMNGEVSELRRLKPLLENKNNDIELSISYLINLLTNDAPFINDFKTIQKEITDDRIFDNVARFSIYLSLYRRQKEILYAINGRNKKLLEIASALLNNNMDYFFTVEKTSEDGIHYFTYKVEDDDSSEKWLIRRICILDLCDSPNSGISDAIKQIVIEPSCFLDEIIILNRTVLEIHSKPLVEIEKIKMVFNRQKELEKKTEDLSLIIKKNFFSTMLRTAILISDDEAFDVIMSVPDELKSDNEIQMLILEIRSRRENIDLKTIMEICDRSNEYWVLHNYLARIAENDSKEAKCLIEENRKVIEKEPSIFFMYLSLTYQFEGRDKAEMLLEHHKDIFGDLLEFKLEEIRIQYNDETLMEIVDSVNNGEYKRLSNRVYPSLINLLIEKNRFNDALSILNRLEKMEMEFPGFKKYKSTILCNLGRDNEALELFLQLFESGDHSTYIVYRVLVICFNNKKTIPEKIMMEAEKSEEVEILNLLSNYYENIGNHDSAIHFNMKALLRTSEDNGNAFGYFIGLRRNQASKKENPIQVSADTFIQLKDENGNIVQYAIYQQDVLPEEDYFWENIHHVSLKYAISLGILRKRLNELVLLNGVCYYVAGLEPLDSCLYRISMGKLLKSNKATAISLDFNEDGRLDYEATAKKFAEVFGVDRERAKWREEYKDLNQIPKTFNIDKELSNATYLQVVSLLLDDRSILIREEIVRREFTGINYIISHAGLIALQQIGWKPSSNTDNYVISQSLMNSVREELNETIDRNNQDHVSTMNIDYDRFFISESSEDNKEKDMKDAVGFCEYCKVFPTIPNNSDLHLEQDMQNNVKQILGVEDYDAFVIAKDENRILVSVELIHSGLCSMSEFNIETMCIAEFLTRESQSVSELFAYIYKMIELRFMVPFTASSLEYIVNYYEENNDEEKKTVLEKWKDIIRYCDNNDEYIELIIDHLRKEIGILKEKQNDLKPAYIELLLTILEASKRKLRFTLNGENQIQIDIIKFNDSEEFAIQQEQLSSEKIEGDFYVKNN